MNAGENIDISTEIMEDSEEFSSEGYETSAESEGIGRFLRQCRGQSHAWRFA